MSLRQVWYSFLAALVVAAVVLGSAWFHTHWNDPDLQTVAVNFAVSWIPFLVTILVAFVPDLRKAHIAWRVGIVSIGLVWSLLLARQQVLTINASRTDQKIIVKEAVGNANQHSDESIATLREDIHKEFDDLNTGITTGLGGLKPPPPKFAAIKFGFLDPFMAAEGSLREGPDRVFSAELLAKNVTDIAAEKGDVWIQICDECLWVDEPIGFDRPSGTIESMRHESFLNLNSGTMLPKITLHFKALKKFQKIILVAKYSCTTCGKMADPQILTVDVLPSMKFDVPPPKLN